jgi:hypothetical protein
MFCKDDKFCRSSFHSHLTDALSFSLYRPESEPFLNDPTGWKSNSIQDAALFIVMNLAAMKSSRDTILELSGVNAMTKITEYNKRIRKDKTDYSSDEQKQLEFQRLKAVSSLFLWSMILGFFVVD